MNDDGSPGERNDVRCVSIEHKLGIHGSPTCVLAYGDQGGAIGYLVGEPNRGLEYMFIMMNAARLSVGLEGYALAERAYQRRSSGRAVVSRVARPARHEAHGDKPAPIAYHGDVKRMLLTMKSHTDAARSIALYVALQLDLARHHPDAAVRAAAQARADLLIPIIKGWSTELGVQMTSLGIQVHGGMGFIEETGAAQYYRDARITTIYEGTTGIQAADLIGRKLFRDGGAAMNALIEEMTAELRAPASDAEVQKARAAALRGVELLKNATAALLQSAKAGVDYGQAVSVPYLTLSGIVIGGWLAARACDLAVRNLGQDREFYAGKRQIARFYLQQVLPEAAALASVVIDGGASVTEADPALFA